MFATKKIGSIFLSMAVGLFSYLAYQTWQQSDDVIWKKSSPEKRLTLLVEKDLKILSASKSLPPEWKEIKLVSYKINSSRLQALLEKQRPKMRIDSDVERDAKKKSVNEYQAEVDVLEMPDEENPGFIFQISLFDLKTKNKIFEIGRTYYFSDLEKDSPHLTSVAHSN